MNQKNHHGPSQLRKPKKYSYLKVTQTSRSSSPLALHDSETEAQLIKFLRENSYTFVWTAEDLRGVNKSLIEHSLHVSDKYSLVKQKLRKMSEEQKQAAKEEVKHLLDARVIHLVKYPSWLSNVVPM